ncbi:hypothetical protein [Micromonospora zingiberis]|uniref:hypothetical protein n=1 Tax=Micromonospora zingiberis TaxID=2053011 RepID=UPI0013F3DE6B|nr:hypothetical protein [Micromonospora zingiberis]
MRGLIATGRSGAGRCGRADYRWALDLGQREPTEASPASAPTAIAGRRAPQRCRRM